MTSKATGTSNGHRDSCTKCSSKNPPEANGAIANGLDSCQHTPHNSDNVSKVAHKLHQLEMGQRKIIQLLTSIEKELSAKEKSCCSKHHHQLQQQQEQNLTATEVSNSNIISNTSSTTMGHIHQGWVREEDSGQGNGERLVKIHLQDATTSTKHVGFRIDKSCQTVLLVNGGSSTPENVGGDQDDIEAECSCKNGHDDKELIRLREELKKATHALSEAMAVKTTEEGIDFGAESPLNLFIQCFKEKYGLVVNPNDVAIFV